jgi:uncharacterized protein YyaL (SSP411 family)
MRSVRLAACFAAVLLIAAGSLVTRAADSAKVRWLTDLNEAHRLSQKTHKPMLLVFGAEWCQYCKKLEATTLKSDEVARYINANYIPVHIDSDKQPRVSEILEVSGLPCTVVLSPEADLLARVNGYKAPSAYYEELVKARRNYQTAVKRQFGLGPS